MTRVAQFVLTRFHSKAAVLAIALILCWAIPAAAQYSAGSWRASDNGKAPLRGRRRNLPEVFPAVPPPMKFCV